MLLSVIDPDELRAHARRVLRRGRVPLAARPPRGLEALRGQPVHARRPARRAGSTTSRPSRPRRMFGGNSNWRGPIWMPRQLPRDPPVRHLPALLRRRLHARVPDRLGPAAHASARSRRTSPTGSSRSGCRAPTAAAPSTAAPSGSRPTRPGRTTCLFNEYFHGDNGAGLGATHQTGWTALVADLILLPPSAGLTLRAGAVVATERA